MKKIVLSIALLSFSFPIIADDEGGSEAFPDHSSITFMFPDPITHNLMIEQSLWHHYTYHKRGSFQGALQVYPFFQKTRADENREDHIPGYFLINCKNKLLIRGSDLNGQRDVRAEWLGLPSDFSGEMTISPVQKQYGAGIEYHQNLNRFFTYDFLKYFWVSVTLPIVVAKNNPRIRQSDIVNPGTTDPKDILQAFNQPSWHYAKIDGECKKMGIAEAKLRLGSALYKKHRYEVDIWTLLSIPTSSRANPAFLFSPFIGNNRHFTIGSGVNFQFPLTRVTAPLPILFFLHD